MDNQRISKLIDKFLKGTASAAETAELNRWYLNQNEGEIAWPNKQETDDDVEMRMLKHIKAHVSSSQKVIPVYRRSWVQAAAILIAVIAAAYFLQGNHASTEKTAQNVSVKSAPAGSPENRFIRLPDSTTILLRSGSELHYRFTTKLREVFLVGEAYFDVKHQQTRPFLVRTGKLTTTVLGTAFNIRAYPKQPVAVSVSRGKVSVSDDTKRVLAMLTPDQQVSYLSADHTFKVSKVKSQEITKWISTDLQFTDVPLGVLADRLSRRYNITVRFKNEQLKHCLINGRFTGDEAPEDLLRTLTQTIGATVTTDSDGFVIDGEGCGN